MSAQPVNRDAWRSLVIEEPIDPGLPIIDAHHHLWPEPPVPHLEAYGIYDDVLVRHGGAWRFASRRFTVLAVRIIPIAS
jgi:hypothetical protein